MIFQGRQTGPRNGGIRKFSESAWPAFLGAVYPCRADSKEFRLLVDWSNERYFRVYVRDTVTWNLLGYEGQTVLMHLGRRLDRAGVLDIPVGCTPEEAVRAVTAVPESVIAAGLPRLLKHEVFVVDDDRLLMPNYIDAQEATATNAERSRRHRARRKAAEKLDTATKRYASDTKRDGNDTKRDASATDSNAAQRGATPYRTVPSVPSVPSVPAKEEEKESKEKKKKRGNSLSVELLRDVEYLFALWCELFGHPQAKLDSKREKLLAKWIKVFGRDGVEHAIQAAYANEWMREKNHKLTWILRDQEQIELLIAAHEKGGDPGTVDTYVPPPTLFELGQMGRKKGSGSS